MIRMLLRAKMKWSLPLISAVLLAIASIPAKAIDIKVVTSSKGVTAWLVEDRSIPLISMQYSFLGGSAADPETKEGLAQFLTGMLDEGAGELGSQEFQRRRQELSVRMSFDADRDEFTGSFQALSRNLEASFDLLKLSLTQSRFDQGPLDRIRKQLLISVKQSLQDPSTIANESWLQAMVSDHPYAKPVNGSVAGINAITSEDLKALVERLFARDQLMIAVVGDITEEQLKQQLDKVFGDMPLKSGMPAVREATLEQGPVQKVIERNIPQSIIRFGHIGILRDDPDFLTAFVMNHIMGGGGFGSRLVEEVREKRGLTYSIFSTLYPLDGAGMYYGGVSTVNNRVSETLDVVKGEFKRMAEQGPSAKELEEAKTYLTGSYALRFSSSRRIAGQLLGIQRENLGLDYIKTRNAKIEAITLEDVRRVAKRLLRPDNLVITIVGQPEGV